MSLAKNEQLFKLEDAVQKCRRQGKVCLWNTNGCAITFTGTLPKDSIVARTNVLVSENDAGLVMLICISPKMGNVTVVGTDNFSSLEQLKGNHPQLFEKTGEYTAI